MASKINIDVNDVVASAGGGARPDTSPSTAPSSGGMQQASAIKDSRNEVPVDRVGRDDAQIETGRENAAVLDREAADAGRGDVDRRQQRLDDRHHEDDRNRANKTDRQRPDVDNRQDNADRHDLQPLSASVSSGYDSNLQSVAGVEVDTIDQSLVQIADPAGPAGESSANQLEESLDEIVSPESEGTEEMAEEDPSRAYMPEASESGTSAGISSSSSGYPSVASPIEFGVSDPAIPEKPVFYRRKPKRRFREMAASARDTAERSLKKRGKKGRTLSGMMVSDADQSIPDVSVGTEIAMFACEQPDSDLPEFLEGMTGIPREKIVEIADTRDPLGMTELVELVNKAPRTVVYGEKQPVVGMSDQMGVGFRMHIGDGMHIHPLLAKAFNADYDGDTFKVVVRKGAANGLPNPMGRIVNANGHINIDPAFFDLPDLSAEGYRAGCRAVCSAVFSKYGASISDRVADVIGDKLHDASIDKKNESKWVPLIGEIRKAAKFVDARRVDDIIADMIGAMYRWGKEKRGFQLASMAEDEANLFAQMPAADPFLENVTSDDEKIAMWMSGVIANVHSNPFNYQDFVNMFGMSTQFHKGKNIQFRISASFGKMIKLDKSMLVGSEYVVNSEHLVDLYEHCADFMMTKIMSSRIDSGEKQFYVASYVRNKIIGGSRLFDNGSPLMPSMYINKHGKMDWNSFLVEFRRRYEAWNYMADQADIDVRTDFSIERGVPKNRGSLNRHRPTGSPASDARWFLRVYGDMTMETLFGTEMKRNWGQENFARTHIAPYRKMTLAEWVNRQDGSIGRIDEKELERERNGGERTTQTMLIALADIRRRASSEFDRQMDDAAKVAFDRLGELREILTYYDSADSFDYAYFVDSATEHLSMLGSEVFEYYNMDDPRKWINSKWGQALLNASSADNVRDLLVRMLVNYRIGKVKSISSQYYSERKSGAMVSEKLDSIEARYKREMCALASSSPLWNMIVKDFDTRGSFFRTHVERNADIESSLEKNEEFKVDGKNMNFKGWDELEPFSNIMDVLDDDGFSFVEKMDILCDLLKIATGKNYTRSEMDWMLRQGPSGTHSGQIFANADGYSKAMEQVKEASKWLGENTKAEIDKMRLDVEDVMAKAKPGDLTRRLEHIRRNMSNVVTVEKDNYVDALNTVMDKFFADTEKGSQQDAINCIHSALSLNKSGGLFSDLAVCDDFLSGKIPEDRFIRNPLFAVYLMANPDASLIVYNENGEHEVSFGGMSEEDLKEWLVDHPRVAMGLRDFRAVPTKDGKCVLGARGNLSDAILDRPKPDPMEEARHLLMNHPGFGSLCIAGLNISGRDSRQTRNELMVHVDKVVVQVVKLARLNDSELRDFLDNGVVYGDGPETKSQEEIDEKKAKLRKFLKRYAGEIRRSGIDLSDVRGVPTIRFNLDDPSVFSAIDDIEQMLTGSKTDNMTAVNGGETRRNGMLAAYASYVPDPPEGDAPPKRIPRDKVMADFDRYRGWITESGYPLTMEYADSLMRDGFLHAYDPAECTCKGHCCKNHSVADASSEGRANRQMTAMSLMIVIQRMDGTEKNNLKAQKSGDDGLDSIVKFSVFDYLKAGGKVSEWFSSVENDVMRKYGPERNLPEARRELARLLRDNQRELDYDDLTISQYENIASMLLFEDESGLRVLSAGQLAYVINRGVSMSDVEESIGDGVEGLVGLLDDVVLSYGFSGKGFDVEEMWARMGVQNRMGRRTVSRGRSSSYDRTFQYMERIAEHVHTPYRDANGNFLVDGNGNRVTGPVLPRTREDIRTISNGLATRYEKVVKKFEYAAKFEKSGYSGDWVYRYDPRTTYDLLGVLTSDNFAIAGRTVQVSPASMWVIDGSVTEFAEAMKVAADWIRVARRFGVAVATDNPDVLEVIDPRYLDKAVEHVDNRGRKTYILPFFDIIMNEFDIDEKGPDETFSIGVTRIPEGRLTRMVESTQAEFDFGDASAKTTEYSAGTMGCRKTGTYDVKMSKLFGPTLEEHYASIPSKTWNRDWTLDDIRFEVCDKANAEYLFLNRSDEEVLNLVDLGVDRQSGKYADAKRDFLRALGKWRSTAESRQYESSGTFSGARPGDIVAWVKMTIPGKDPVYAPIRPFRLDEGKGSPAEFSVDYLDREGRVDKALDESGVIRMSWKHESSLLGRIFKFFEGRNAANKFIVSDVPIKGDRLLRNGQHITLYVSHESAFSRRMSNVVSDTMYTLICEMRCANLGYNLAERDDSFPGRRDIHDALLSGECSYEDWMEWMDEAEDKLVFLPPISEDNRKLNAWLNMTVRRCLDVGVPPHLWLASRFGGPEGRPHEMAFRYDALFAAGANFQEGLQMFMNLMNPDVCPKEVGGDSKGKLFKNLDDGSLAMSVPYYDPKGNLYYAWERVYTSYSFLDQHYGGLIKPQVSGSQSSPSALLNALYNGKIVDAENELRMLATYSMTDVPWDINMSPMSMMIEE